MIGAREDLLDAARKLTRRGAAPSRRLSSSPKLGLEAATTPTASAVPSSWPTCASTHPRNSAMKHSDLRRVGRGLVPAGRRGVLGSGHRSSRCRGTRSSAVPAASDIRQTPPPSGVGRQRAGRCRAAAGGGGLEHTPCGRSLLSLARGRPRRLQGTAAGGGQGIRVATYVRGPKEGTAKAGGVAMQARTYYAGAVLGGMLTRSEHRPSAPGASGCRNVPGPDRPYLRSARPRRVELGWLTKRGPSPRLGDHNESRWSDPFAQGAGAGSRRIGREEGGRL